MKANYVWILNNGAITLDIYSPSRRMAWSHFPSWQIWDHSFSSDSWLYVHLQLLSPITISLTTLHCHFMNIFSVFSLEIIDLWYDKLFFSRLAMKRRNVWYRRSSFCRHSSYLKIYGQGVDLRHLYAFCYRVENIPIFV